MSATVTDAEIGKRVVSAEGDSLGMVASVEEEVAYVEPEPGLIDRLKGAVGWESESEDVVPIPTTSVEDVTDDEVRLEHGFTETGPPGGDPVSQGSDTPPAAGGRGDRTETSLEDDAGAPIDSDDERTDDASTASSGSDPMGEIDADDSPRTTEEDVTRESIEEIGDEEEGGASREIGTQDEDDEMGGSREDAEADQRRDEGDH